MDKKDDSVYVGAMVPQDTASAALNSDWVSMKYFNHAEIIIVKAAGAVGEAPTITLKQATAIAGTGSKALNFTSYTRRTAADITSTSIPTKTTQAATNALTLAAGNTQEVIVIEFDAQNLDAHNGFNCFRVEFGDVGTTAQLAAVVVRLSECGYNPYLVNAGA